MKRTTVLVPLATALASLTTAANANAPVASSTDQSDGMAGTENTQAPTVEPNTLFTAGNELLGMLVMKKSDGTVVAQHVSHASHASHTSHSSGF